MGVLIYAICRPLAKTILIDVFELNRSSLSHVEMVTMPIIVGLFGILMVTVLVVKNIINSDNKYIANELTDSTYGSYDVSKLKFYYKNTIKPNFENIPEFNVISKRYNKSVYAIIGGWRAGKTSAAGILLYILRKDEEKRKDNKIISETYHDTFNFGNVDESIATFFSTLANKTGVSEFKRLGKVSTPGLDMNINLGIFTVKRPLEFTLAANKLRNRIYDKLKDQNGFHVIILDDLDRLMALEQVQWLRVIELLGKFHGKLVLIVPVHLGQIIKGLDKYDLSAKYIDKILPNKISVGVNIDFIRKKFGISDLSGDEVKKRYAKYLFSLAIRSSISKINSKDISIRTEWKNEFNLGNISGIGAYFKEGLARRGIENSQTSVIGHTLNYNDTLWFKESRGNYDSNEIFNLTKNSFLQGAFTETERIDSRDVNVLRRVDMLSYIFDDNSYVIGTSQYNLDIDAVSDWHDLWLENLWPIADSVSFDSNISEYFQYDFIEEEIARLKSIESLDDEINFFRKVVLDWK